MSTLLVRFITVDGAQGERDASALAPIRVILNWLFDEKIIVGGNILHRYPKQLMWNGIDLCDNLDKTLADIGFDEDGDPITFVPFGDVDEMFEASMKAKQKLENLLQQQQRFGDGLSQTTMANTAEVQRLHIAKATGKTYKYFINSLATHRNRWRCP